MTRPLPTLSRLVDLPEDQQEPHLVPDTQPLFHLVEAINDRFGIIDDYFGVIMPVAVQIRRDPSVSGMLIAFSVENDTGKLFDLHTIVLTKGLLEKASSREIAALIAHELSHIALGTEIPERPRSRLRHALRVPQLDNWRHEFRADAAAAVLFGTAACEMLLRRSHAQSSDASWRDRFLHHPALALRLHHLRRETYFKEWKHLNPSQRPNTEAISPSPGLRIA